MRERTMTKLMWILFGCGVALILAGVAMLIPSQQLVADRIKGGATATPTPTVAAPAPAPTTDGPAPSGAPSLSWERANAAAGSCERLTIDQAQGTYYGPCAGGMRRVDLSAEDYGQFLAWAARYDSFEYEGRPGTGQDATLTRVVVTLIGDGGATPTADEKVAIAAWLGERYERFVLDEERADAIARARAALAQRLGILPEAIVLVSVEEVVWPNACLGVEGTGLFCAQVATPGFRVLLAAGKAHYTVHTDRRDQAIVAATDEGAAAADPTRTPIDQPTAVPTAGSAQTATPWPTSVPTSTPRPTATSWPTAIPMPEGMWFAQYYDNTTLSGAPVVSRTENTPRIAYDWGYGAPVGGVPADNYSVRWSRREAFTGGKYNWKLRGDDGVRLWVDGRLVIDRWHGGYSDDTVPLDMWEGDHDIVLEYFELSGVASVRLTWEKFYDPKPDPSATIPADAWLGEYYDNTSLDGEPALVRADPAISFEWGMGAPASRVPADRFGARWTRTVALKAGGYVFYAQTDDGVRLSVDGNVIIDAWRDGLAEDLSAEVWLTAGRHDLKVEYYDAGGNASARVWWEAVAAFSDWKGEYYGNRHLEGEPKVVRNDAAIAYDWGRGRPADGLPTNDYAVRWSRTVALVAGRYRFTATADDGVRFLIDGTPVIDKWNDSPGHTHVTELSLTAGEYDLVVEYYEKRGYAQCYAGWELIEVEATPTATPVPPTPTATAVPPTPTHTAQPPTPTRTPTTVPATATPTALPPTATATAALPTAAATVVPPTPTHTITPGGLPTMAKPTVDPNGLPPTRTPTADGQPTATATGQAAGAPTATPTATATATLRPWRLWWATPVPGATPVPFERVGGYMPR